MGRPPADLVARLNQEIAVERLVAAHGVELQRDGTRIREVCPFHSDDGRSLVIDAKRNTWRCEAGCAADGSAVEWVQKARGISRHRPIAELRAEFLSAEGSEGQTPVSLRVSSRPSLRYGGESLMPRSGVRRERHLGMQCGRKRRIFRGRGSQAPVRSGALR